MNIGVYIPGISPLAGGASSLVKTIQKQLIASEEKKDTYLILYFGYTEPYRTEVEGITYINLYQLDNHYSFWKRGCRKIGRMFRISEPKFPWFDTVTVREQIDLFWITGPFDVDIHYPYIYTVWDLGHRTTSFFPEVSRSGWLWNDREKVYQKMLAPASYILTGNQEGKKEILQNYPVNPAKIRLAPFPVADFCHGPESRPSFIAEDDEFFFYPAQFWPHKNHIRILQALLLLREKNLFPVVYFTGSDKGNRSFIETKIKEWGLETQIHFTGFISDEEMKYMYTHAKAMIFASLMGPNNMPPIEATYLNCPVIITDLDGHKEQLGDTALYFKGTDASSLAEQMERVLTDSALVTDLKMKQQPLAEKFGKVDYFSTVAEIIDEFRSFRETWGDEYIHL